MFAEGVTAKATLAQVVAVNDAIDAVGFTVITTVKLLLVVQPFDSVGCKV